jgi:hypothetical protein
VRRGVEALRDGRYRVRLEKAAPALLAQLAAEARELIGESDPAVSRLFPPAYPDDPVAAEQYAGLVRGELEAGRVAALRTLEETAGADYLDQAQADAWCGAVNDLRLILGDGLELPADGGEWEFDPDDPGAPRISAYLWLTWLQSSLIDALTTRLR